MLLSLVFFFLSIEIVFKKKKKRVEVCCPHKKEEDEHVKHSGNSDCLRPVSSTTLRVKQLLLHPRCHVGFSKHSGFFKRLNLETFSDKCRCLVPLLCSEILLIKRSPGNFPRISVSSLFL